MSFRILPAGQVISESNYKLVITNSGIYAGVKAALKHGL